jgi:hypothetical protein
LPRDGLPWNPLFGHQNGLQTLPEILESGLIATSDRCSLNEVCPSISSLSKLQPKNDSSTELRNVISIRNFTSEILSL